MSTRRSARRPRRHGVTLEPADRRALERDGWRTTLDYRENHIRGTDGQLVEVQPRWIAEAERYAGQLAVVTAHGATIDEAWARLRRSVERNDGAPPSRVRVLRP